MIDEFFAPKKDTAPVTIDPSKKENCAPFSDKKDSTGREELRTGALSKRE
jgi:hypothetical protein